MVTYERRREHSFTVPSGDQLLDYEYGVLAELASQQGKVLSYDQLFEAGWGRSDDQASKRVMYAVRRIGLKLGWRKDDWQHFPIEAVPGSGYRYRSQS